MQKSAVSQNVTNPSMFLLPNRVWYLPIFVYSPENFLISNLSRQLIFSVLLHIHISKASNLQRPVSIKYSFMANNHKYCNVLLRQGPLGETTAF